MAVWFPVLLKRPPFDPSEYSITVFTVSSIRVSVTLILYLSCMLGLAEERCLGCEESEVFALFIQAAIPAAHAVTACHGGGQHCIDSHEEVQRRPPAPAQHQSSTLTA